MSLLSKTLTPTESDRRNTIRYQITVAAEVIEIRSGTRFSTRTTDLGPGGCFVDSLMPLPVGTAVRVRLSKDNISFDASGVVTFSQTGLGMGVAFDPMPAERQSALDAWLNELMEPRQTRLEVNLSTPRVESPSQHPTEEVTHRLIRLLVKRRLITEKEAAELLGDPLLLL
jgi:PilZ domain